MAYLFAAWPGRPAWIRYEYDLLVGQCARVTNGYAISRIAITRTGTNITLDSATSELFLAETVATDDGGVDFPAPHRLGPIDRDVWVHVAVNAVLRASSTHYSVTLHRDDDASADRVTEFAGAAGATSDGTIAIGLGFQVPAPYATCSVTFDNFTLDFD